MTCGSRSRLAFLWLVLACPSHAAGLDRSTTTRIDGAVRTILERSGTPSASIAVIEHGQLAYVHAYGRARLSPPIKATTATRYQIASLSKEIVAAAALLLQQDGRLSLDDPVSRWLPGLTASRRITLRECLNQTSGYPDYWPQDYVTDWLRRPTSTDAILDAWAKRPLDFAPGERWEYSNTNYVVAGRIIELASGMTLAAFVDARIFRPLGISDAIDADHHPLGAPDAGGTIRAALGPARPQPPSGAGWMFGAWPFALTASDIGRWDLSILHRTLLTSGSYDQEMTPGTLNDGRKTDYALGLTISTKNGRRLISHDGEGAGYLSDNRLYPDDGIAIAVLVNTMSGQSGGDIADAVEDLVLPPRPLDLKARAAFASLQRGAPDRTAFTAAFNAYLTGSAVADYARTLAPLGTPTSFQETDSWPRGGMTYHQYRVVAGNRPLKLSTYVTPDGRFEQFLVSPATR